jgi:metal-responsive CopG/Arc/MetJ family transcriptional regulator
MLSRMARKQVIVQLDERMVKALDKEARRMGVSRSELIRRGVGALLEAGSEAEAVRAMIRAYMEAPQDGTWAESSERTASESWDSW